MKSGAGERSSSGGRFAFLCVVLTSCTVAAAGLGCGGADTSTSEDTGRAVSELHACDDVVAKVTRMTPHGDPFLHRSGHSIAAVDNKLYVVRGIVDNFDTQENFFPEDVVRIQPGNGHVKQMDQRGDSIPGGLAYSCVAADDAQSGSLYLFGGGHYVFELRPDFFSSLVVNDTLFKYDIGNKTWQALAPAGARPTARNGCAADFAGGAMYMFGGISRFFAVNNEMWKFDPGVGTWTRLTQAGAVPSPRYKPLSALDREDGKIYYYGGLANGPAGFSRIDDFWVYDVASNTYRQLPIGMSPARDQGTLSLLKGPNGKKYVVHVGGDLPTETSCTGFPQKAQATNEVWAFDVSEETWKQLDVEGQMPRIEYHAGASLKNRHYFAGGWAEEPDPTRTCRQVWNESFYELSLVRR